MNITDPLNKDGAQAEGAQDGNAQEGPRLSPTGHPYVEDCHQGFYSDFDPISDAAQKTLSSAGCYVGSPLEVRFEGEGDERRPVLVAANDVVLGYVHHRVESRLVRLLEAGWNVSAMLSLVTYSQADKSFYGEAAFMCWNPEQPQEVLDPIAEFRRHQEKRLKGGDHPSLSLDQKDFEKVLDSNGEWFMTAESQISKQQRKRTKYKSHQSFSDKAVDASTEHRTGCSVASTIFLIALAAVIVLVVVKLIF